MHTMHHKMEMKTVMQYDRFSLMFNDLKVRKQTRSCSVKPDNP